jgi:hypothetical protein
MAGWRWETSPTGGPHLSARGRERRGKEAGALAGRVGRKRVWAAAEKRKEGEVRWAAGLGWAGGVGLGFFFSFSFSNGFQTNFSNHFQIKSFPYFNTNLSNYFKTFRKLFKQLFKHF